MEEQRQGIEISDNRSSFSDSDTVRIDDEQLEQLLKPESSPEHGDCGFTTAPRKRFTLRHLVASNAASIVVTVVLSLLFVRVLPVKSSGRPSSLVYSPVLGRMNNYHKVQFKTGLFTRGNEYMGFPTDETDALWEDLYNFGNSIITKAEADQLTIPTLAIPGTEDYLVQLDVFHDLHCLNMLRKVFYPERFGDALHSLMDAAGNVNRTTNRFRHWDHCIDALRQSLMCNADVSPISWHVGEPPPGAVGEIGIFPRLSTVHSCRDFGSIRQWALEHRAPKFKYLLSPEEAQHIKDTAGFDQASFEDLSEFFQGAE